MDCRTSARLKTVAAVVLLALGLIAAAAALPGLLSPEASPALTNAPSPFDPRTDAAATTGFGEELFVHRIGDELTLNLTVPEGVQILASYELPDKPEFVVAHQLICADGTGPERSLVVFGATWPSSRVGSLSMDLFDGSFVRTLTGLFLFVGSEPPLGGARWVLKSERRTVVSGSVVLAMPIDPANPPVAPCDDWDPLNQGDE